MKIRFCKKFSNCFKSASLRFALFAILILFFWLYLNRWMRRTTTTTISTTQTFPIKLNTNKGNQKQQMVRIKMMLISDDSIEPIKIALLNDANKEGVSPKMGMNFTIGTDTDLQIHLPESISVLGKGERLARGSYALDLDIVLSKRCYLLRIGDGSASRLLGGITCPKGGANQIPWKDINMIKIQGQMRLLADPFVQQISNGADVQSEEFEIRFQNIQMSCWMEFARGCPANTKLLMLSMTRRGRDGFKKRMGIRQTWMKDAVPGEVIRFLVADSAAEGESADVQQILETEQKVHGDLVFLHGFVDKYTHNHLKWYSALRWQQSFCADANWVMKVDDDSVVHLRRLAHWTEKKFRQNVTDHPLIFIGNFGATDVHRDPRSPWCVNRTVYPTDEYPPFTSGGAYLTTPATVRATMAHAAQIVAFHIDDVVFTGILAKLANANVWEQQMHFLFPPSIGPYIVVWTECRPRSH